MDQLETTQRLQAIRDGLFLIVGPQRSGTTLLQAMLTSHSGLTVPPETEFFDQVWPRRTFLGPLTSTNLPRVERYLTGPNCSVSDLDLDWPAVTSRLSTTPGGYDDLFVTILAWYADRRGKRRVGEKSPRHLFHANELRQLFPNAKFLCLVRDPRAVVLSELETSWGSKSVSRIAARWCQFMDALGKLEESWPADRLQVVRYEDLVTDPESVLRRVCHFLGEQFEPRMLQFDQRPESERGFRSDEVWKQNTLQAVNVDRIERWQKGLTPARIQLIEKRVGSRLVERGYQPYGKAGSLSERVSTWCIDHLRWVGELAWGVLKGRRRRRPWSCVWKELLGK